MPRTVQSRKVSSYLRLLEQLSAGHRAQLCSAREQRGWGQRADVSVLFVTKTQGCLQHDTVLVDETHAHTPVTKGMSHPKEFSQGGSGNPCRCCLGNQSQNPSLMMTVTAEEQCCESLLAVPSGHPYPQQYLPLLDKKKKEEE